MATTPTHAYDSEYQSIYFRVYSVEVNDKKTIIELSERARSQIKKSLIRVTVKRKELHKIKKKCRQFRQVTIWTYIIRWILLSPISADQTCKYSCPCSISVCKRTSSYWNHRVKSYVTLENSDFKESFKFRVTFMVSLCTVLLMHCDLCGLGSQILIRILPKERTLS